MGAEDLDRDALCRFLATWDSAFADPAAVEITGYKGGYSNLTVRVTAGTAGGERVCVVRRAPPGKKAATAHDMVREAKLLRRLRPHYRYCPEVYAVCEDDSVIGTPFFVMEELQGLIPGRKLPEGMTPGQVRALCRSLVERHAELHALDLQATGLHDLGKPDGYVRRQIEGWTRRWRDARTDDVPDGEAVAAWLAANLPPETGPSAGGASVIHNDFKLDNVVLDPADPTRIIGVLDWEMATVGDPLMDLGASLAYWIERGDPDDLKLIAMMPTTADGMMTRAEIVETYRELTGRTFGDPTFYLTYGVFRLAVIGQQIYARYKLGQTPDPKFAGFGIMVTLLLQHAERLIR